MKLNRISQIEAKVDSSTTAEALHVQPQLHKTSVSGRAFWETLLNSESNFSSWEITKDDSNKTVRLLYVPNENYSKDDIEIKVSFEVFKDLLDFMVRLSQPCS